MHERRLVWRLFVSYVLLASLALLALGWYASKTLDSALTNALVDRLEMTARAGAEQVEPAMSSTSGVPTHADDESSGPVATSTAQQISTRLANLSHSRLTVVLPSGKVLADTSEPPERMENHADRPELIAALRGDSSRDNRFSATVGERMLYVAVPIRRGEAIIGAVRAAVPTSVSNQQLRHYQLQLLGGLGVIGAVIAAIGYFFARRQSGPIEAVSLAAQRFAGGDLLQRLPGHEVRELARLSESLNQMATQLEERSHTIGRKGHEQEAVLASMVEGVLAVDSDERIISINRAAAQLVGATAAEVFGRSLQEVIRNADLRRFATRALESEDSIEDDMTLRGENERVLQVRGTALRDTRGRSIGAVIVLNDVTHYRHLENVRRDFVANVSHELKTPIASIKGFVETLLDGAVHHPQDSERFLKIVAKQADRLNSIIEDLLSLSKIEQSEEDASLPVEPGSIKDLLDAAVYDCQTKAADRNITVNISCEDTVMGNINERLLEQAIVNLLDNAIKYSEPGSEVLISGRTNTHEVTIAVSDHGCGIEKDHLPRLFERFYRVDKARSRKLGGTGLGLSIVKHIVQAHRGRVSVISTPGKGSTFTVHLPAIR